MTFASDAQRRWFFANNSGLSSSSSSNDKPTFSSKEEQDSYYLAQSERKIKEMQHMFPSLKLTDSDARAAASDYEDYHKKYGVFK